MTETIEHAIARLLTPLEQYLPQGREASAIHDAIACQHRAGGGFFDCGTYYEAARDALNRLSKAGCIVVDAQTVEDMAGVIDELVAGLEFIGQAFERIDGAADAAMCLDTKDGRSLTSCPTESAESMAELFVRAMLASDLTRPFEP